MRTRDTREKVIVNRRGKDEKKRERVRDIGPPIVLCLKPCYINAKNMLHKVE